VNKTDEDTKLATLQNTRLPSNGEV